MLLRSVHLDIEPVICNHVEHDGSPRGERVLHTRAGEKPDRLTAENGQTYVVTASGSLVRTSSGGSVNMPSVGGMLGQGDQTADHDYTIATARATEDTTGMEASITSGGKTRTVKATRGVVIDGHYYGVFVVKPSFSGDEVRSVTHTTAAGRISVNR